LSNLSFSPQETKGAGRELSNTHPFGVRNLAIPDLISYSDPKVPRRCRLQPTVQGTV
jgi:hypothetical protein